MGSPGFQITPVTRLAVLLGLVWAIVGMALAFGGLGIAAFFVVAVVAAPLDVYLLRRSGRNTYRGPDAPPRTRRHGASRGAGDVRAGEEATARR